MFRFLFKLAIVIIGLYILIQIPFFREKYEDMKMSFYEKVDNVMAEVDRIRGKVEDVKEKVDQTKQTVTDIKDKVIETKEKVEGALETIDKTVDAIDSALNGDKEEEAVENEKGPDPETPESSSGSGEEE